MLNLHKIALNMKKKAQGEAPKEMDISFDVGQYHYTQDVVKKWEAPWYGGPPLRESDNNDGDNLKTFLMLNDGTDEIFNLNIIEAYDLDGLKDILNTQWMTPEELEEYNEEQILNPQWDPSRGAAEFLGKTFWKVPNKETAIRIIKDIDNEPSIMDDPPKMTEIFDKWINQIYTKFVPMDKIDWTLPATTSSLMLGPDYGTKLPEGMPPDIAVRLGMKKKAQDERFLTEYHLQAQEEEEDVFGNIPLKEGEEVYRVIPTPGKLEHAVEFVADGYEAFKKAFNTPEDMTILISELVGLWEGEFDVYIPQENITPEILGRGFMQIVEAYGEPAYVGSKTFPQAYSEFIKAAQWFIDNGFIQGVEPVEGPLESFTGSHIMWWRHSIRLNMKKAAQWKEDDSNEPWEQESWRPQLTPEELEREFKELEPDFGKGMWGILNPYYDDPTTHPNIPPDILLKALDSGQVVILEFNREYTIHLLNEFLGEDMYMTPNQALITYLLDSGKLHEISEGGYEVLTSDKAFESVKKFLANIHQDLLESTHEEKFDLPENLPPGIAVRLNMKKSTI